MDQDELREIERRARAMPKRFSGRLYPEFDGWGYRVDVGSERAVRAVKRFLDHGRDDVLGLVTEVRRLQGELRDRG